MSEKTYPFKFESVVSVYRKSFSTIFENPSILFLFLTILFFDLLALGVLFLAPSWPFSVVLAPIIRAFWDERFLHYPENFVLLPKLFTHAHFMIQTVYGVVVSSMVIKKIEALESGEKLSTGASFVIVLKRYFSVLLVWLFSYGTFVLILKSLLGVFAGIAAAQFIIALIVSILLQAFYSYLLPAVLIEDAGFFKKIFLGLKAGFKNLFFTSGLIFLPVFLTVLFAFLKAFSVFFVRMTPEIVGLILLMGIAVMLLADTMVTVTTTLFYLQVRSKK